ncbi:hypothetical protein J5N58_06805 [Rhizobium cremeum]|uniref:hypothetical protein n=1 Tax=Rhizobium cremeum TaxID=2813827 RepID=UPI001FD530C0|nr:hypothetical protein [Rhizobium cremeum]MCJ7996660.1 hypothetical protein [Rhizobium cremeum]MCJ7999384.1 hypothetical protein [Rhizobium cremeum]
MIRFQPVATTPPVPQPPRCIRSLQERMADDMRELAFAGRDVSLETLVERGWTPDTVKRLAPEAREIARRKAVTQTARA